ncbi:MAG: hypothetical protein ABSF98_21880 [Bryobacteraceae bacterium]|jgi:hypothetical protein
MHSSITKRIVAQSGLPRLVPVLADELSPGDLQSLLLAVYRKRAQKMTEPDALARFERTALVAPSNMDARVLNEFDRIAFATAERFEAVELSPVCPLGTSFVLGGIDQNNVLTTIRNAEVLGDSTPALALECARRRRQKARRTANQPVRLASSQRVLRLQPFHFPGFTPHFRLFGLVSAGRDSGSSAFEIQHLGEHIVFYLRLFRALNAAGFSLTAPLVEISDLAATETLLAAAGISGDDVRRSVRAHIVGGSERFLAERGIALPSSTDASLAASPRLAGRIATPRSAPAARRCRVADGVPGGGVSLYPREAGGAWILHGLVPADLSHCAGWPALSHRRRRLHQLDGAPAAGPQGAASHQRDRQRVHLPALSRRRVGVTLAPGLHARRSSSTA